MSQSEIHDFGIEVVSNYMKKEGFVIIQTNTYLGQLPQIVAKREKERILVAVDTDCFPNKGKLSEESRKEMLSMAEREKHRHILRVSESATLKEKQTKRWACPLKEMDSTLLTKVTSE